MSQLTFDLDELIHQAELEAAPPWDGAPLRYHEEARTPAELDAAWDRWILENGSSGCVPDSHMWHVSKYFGVSLTIGMHNLIEYQADARCGGRFGDSDHRHAPGELPNKLMHQVICTTCSWRRISDSASDSVEAAHDHALPGWRNLPAVPLALTHHGDNARAKARFLEWIETHYPHEWQQAGYPIITERNPHQTRHVPGRSPWGGYDIAAPDNV